MRNLQFVIVLALLSQSAIAEMHKIEINNHPVPVQVESWECGPNSAAKMLWHFHGAANQVSQMSQNDYAAFRASCPKTLNGARARTESVGPSPQALAEYMTKHSATHRFEALSDSNIIDLAIGRILNNEPVLATIEVGVFQMRGKLPAIAAGFVNTLLKDDEVLWAPLLHYVVLNGYDPVTNEFSYLDTDGQEKTMSRADLATKLGWYIYVPQALKEALQTLFPLAKMMGLGNVDDLFAVKGNTVIVGNRIG